MQLPCHSDPGITATGQAGGFVEVHVRGAKVQGSKAADSAAGRVGTIEVQAQIAVTGEQTVVGPIPASAGKMFGGEQLAAGGLIETVDVNRQARSLNHTAVGPGVLVDGYATSAHQAATDIVEERRINGEGAVT